MIKYLTLCGMLALASCASQSDQLASDEARVIIPASTTQSAEAAANGGFRKMAEITHDRGYTYFVVESIDEDYTNYAVNIKIKMGDDPYSLKSWSDPEEPAVFWVNP